MQDFDRDGLVHQDVRAAIDRAHPAFIDDLFDAVFVGERLTDERVVRLRQDCAVSRT